MLRELSSVGRILYDICSGQSLNSGHSTYPDEISTHLDYLTKRNSNFLYLNEMVWISSNLINILSLIRVSALTCKEYIVS
jgi:hypothetical protein